MLRIQEDGTVIYDGRYYVGITGDRSRSIGKQVLGEIRLLSDFLVKRNQKNYLKKNLKPVYTVQFTSDLVLEFEIDEGDLVSEDIIRQIIYLTGASEWINAELDLYLVMSRPAIRSRELAVLRAIDRERAISMFLDSRRSRSFRSEDDYIGICIGHQKRDDLVNPTIYFTYSDYQFHERSPSLLLNQGPKLKGNDLDIFLFLTFGKRYNDPGASYFLVLEKDKQSASQLFKSAYPHFMPRDFQQVDLGVEYSPISLLKSHIPIAIR